ncbi:lactonase family protein [Streptomyces sp. NPDC050560]|uniref:lactonase family protein n=1 Tax=Streptomyces sp. NPDC050560 TaxID=3365630 RepID=UPI0037B0952E
MTDERHAHPDAPAPPGAPLTRRLLLGAAGAAALAGLTAAGPTAAAGRRTPAAAAADTRPLLIGTYTSSGGPGIALAAYDTATGALTGTGAASVPDPSFLAAGEGGLRYAVDENEDSVTALTASDDGLTVLGTADTGGTGPCHLAVHAAGGHLLSANYGSGSVSVHSLAADGSLGDRTDLVQHTGSGPDPDRQSGPHTHMVLNDPAGAFVLAVDLGTDTVYTYRLDTGTGKLAAVSAAAVTPGAGPRHATFHPSGQYLYVANELGNTLTVCGYDGDTGKVTPGDSLPTVPPGGGDGERNYPAEPVVSPDGAHLYVSNRGHDSIARYALGGDGGAPELLDTVPAGGAYPRHIALTSDGAWLFAANQNSGTVTAFARDAGSGALTPVGDPFAATAAVCVLPG